LSAKNAKNAKSARTFIYVFVLFAFFAFFADHYFYAYIKVTGCLRVQEQLNKNIRVYLRSPVDFILIFAPAR